MPGCRGHTKHESGHAANLFRRARDRAKSFTADGLFRRGLRNLAVESTARTPYERGVIPINSSFGKRVLSLATLLATTAFSFAAQDWKPAAGPLMTKWAKDVKPSKVLP